MTQSNQGSEKEWKRVRRQSIMDAFVRLLIGEGMESLTMDRVAKEAGITKATIYSYFKDKEELIEVVRVANIEPLRNESQEILMSDLTPDVKLKYITARIFSYCDRHREVIRILNLERIALPAQRYNDNQFITFIEDMTSLFEEGANKGVFKNLSPRTMALFYVESMSGMISSRIYTNDSTPVEEMTLLFQDILLNGIMNPSPD